ncbi:hypothetical protein SODALDRAFT_376517 [Sodiomyces alkalinus F11]|uniref:Uncharacterized protein n=1 Tax=Sodiomyces alkalinus (strain CBS 110278 / VKM F-3762 / F11) TaxID=1314773 RepID=A0A3N2Q1X6_SODAK|nr:hypothetical protein SODALDRAFT_376517 [Sodiomyces alkalinus F11]ROT40759.1 hypothetical protein SODALDRAFT_376517 [Sodiomyces alkalinus F11]
MTKPTKPTKRTSSSRQLGNPRRLDIQSSSIPTAKERDDSNRLQRTTTGTCCCLSVPPYSAQYRICVLYPQLNPLNPLNPLNLQPTELTTWSTTRAPPRLFCKYLSSASASASAPTISPFCTSPKGSRFPLPFTSTGLSKSTTDARTEHAADLFLRSTETPASIWLDPHRVLRLRLLDSLNLLTIIPRHRDHPFSRNSPFFTSVVSPLPCVRSRENYTALQGSGPWFSVLEPRSCPELFFVAANRPELSVPDSSYPPIVPTSRQNNSRLSLGLGPAQVSSLAISRHRRRLRGKTSLKATSDTPKAKGAPFFDEVPYRCSNVQRSDELETETETETGRLTGRVGRSSFFHTPFRRTPLFFFDAGLLGSPYHIDRGLHARRPISLTASSAFLSPRIPMESAEDAPDPRLPSRLLRMASAFVF